MIKEPCRLRAANSRAHGSAHAPIDVGQALRQQSRGAIPGSVWVSPGIGREKSSVS
jgi:hypothetical protein